MVSWMSIWLDGWLKQHDTVESIPCFTIAWFDRTHKITKHKLPLLNGRLRLYDTILTSLLDWALTFQPSGTYRPTQLQLHTWEQAHLTLGDILAHWVMVHLMKVNYSSNLSFQFCQRCLRKLFFFLSSLIPLSPTQLVAYILLCPRSLFSGLSYPISDPQSPAIKFMLLTSGFDRHTGLWILYVCFANGVYIPCVYSSSLNKGTRIYPGEYH